MIRQKCHYVPENEILPTEFGINKHIEFLFEKCNCIEIKQIICDGFAHILYSYEDTTAND